MSASTYPTLAGFAAFITGVMQIAPQYLPINISAPASPILTAGSAGSLPTETVYVVVTYTSTAGETTASPETSIAVVGATGSVSVASPTLVPGVTGWNIYAANATGAEVLQNVTPQPIGTAYVIMTLATGTAGAPVANTAGSPVVGYAFQVALGIVNPALLSVCLPAVPGGPPAANVFALAVYNLAGSQLLQFAQDQPGRVFFAETRKTLGLDKFSPGVVSSQADSTTSTALLNPEFMKNLTLQNLQNLRDPYGRQALAFMQDYGPTIWGLS